MPLLGEVTGREDAPTPVAEELIATKLAPPSVRAGYIPRQRLLDALSAGSDLRLTLVDAPTGYGKTMLVAAWCAEVADREQRVISWLSLATTEDDPALLTRYLITALRRAGATIGERAEAMLQVPGASPTAWMRSLVNDLAVVQAQITLVLDDYHAVTEPACHALVQFLLDHAPASLHLIVCTRADPPIALGSLRAIGQLAEVRTTDLRFTDGEAAALLVETEGLNLDAQAVKSLAARTEGWAAGPYLAALWLRGRGGPEADVERFAGDNRHVVDYLSEVVLDQLDDEGREFLLGTSIVDRLCSSLCEAITNMPVAGVLEEIERSNVFLVPLDDTRTWYRYHHLFAEMLRSELARRHPDRVAVHHRRASAWYRDRGLISEAIEHASSAGDHDDAAELISEYWLEIGRWGQEATLRRWLQAFEPDELQRHPELGVIGAFLTGVSGRSEIEFRRWLELAERGIADAEQNRSPGVDAAALRTRVQQVGSAFGYRNIRTAAATAARTARVESERDGALRVVVLANLAFLLYLSGDPARARHVLSEAIRDPLAQRRPYGFIIALTTSALIALDEGDAARGQHAAARALEFAAAAGLADNQVSALAHVALGRALTAAGRPDSARTEIERGVRLLLGGVMAAQQVYALLWAAPAAQATGDLPSALAFTEEAETLLASFDDAGTLTTLLADVQRRLSLARRRRHEPNSAALTESELAVLRALRSPKSQRAIAQELSISINTVKTHTSAIYRKLAVRSRDDAITRATELGLL
jgi:LuxR family transcriptional regulator, maltose regulon positive regulatory protein